VKINASVQVDTFFRQHTSQDAITKYTNATAGFGITYLSSLHGRFDEHRKKSAPIALSTGIRLPVQRRNNVDEIHPSSVAEFQHANTTFHSLLRQEVERSHRGLF
jgi:hypothetical protein